MIPSTRRPRARRAGFTLIELLIAMTLLSVVMGSMVSVVLRVQRDYVRQRSRSDASTALRSSEQLLSRVFRTAGADPNEVGFVGIYPVPSGAGSVRVVSDYNPADGDTNDPLEDVAFDVSAGAMRVRWQAGGTMTPLVQPVTSVAYAYYRRDGSQVTNMAHVDTAAKRVKITITAPIQRADGTATTVQSVSWAFVRN